MPMAVLKMGLRSSFRKELIFTIFSMSTPQTDVGPCSHGVITASSTFYNDKGIRTWVSKEDFGGFADAYKKESGNLMIEKGSWTLKDRLVAYNAEVLAPKRQSMLNFARSIGYSSAELRSFWWNGSRLKRRAFSRKLEETSLTYSDRRQASRSGQALPAEQCHGLAKRT